MFLNPVLAKSLLVYKDTVLSHSRTYHCLLWVSRFELTTSHFSSEWEVALFHILWAHLSSILLLFLAFMLLGWPLGTQNRPFYSTALVHSAVRDTAFLSVQLTASSHSFISPMVGEEGVGLTPDFWFFLGEQGNQSCQAEKNKGSWGHPRTF